MDGWITIGTKLNTDDFERQVSDLENKIESEEKKQDFLNKKTKEYKKAIKEANEELRALNTEYNRITAKANKMKFNADTANGEKEARALTKEYEKLAREADKIEAKIQRTNKSQSNLRNKVIQTRLQHENSAKAVDRMKGRIDRLSFKRQEKEAKELARSMNKVKDGVTNTISKLGKMAIAVLGVRSAYSALTRASSTLSQYNQQYAANLEYIRYALASGLFPILQKILGLIQTIMTYINYLSNAWFGKQIFASAKDFQNMQKSASGVAKSTKEIKNNLASFDELNVLDTNKGADAGGGGLAPSFDLGDIEDVEIPEWLNKIKELFAPLFEFFEKIKKDHGPVAAGITAIVIALGGLMILKTINKLLKGTGGGFDSLLKSLGKAAETVAILWGLSEVIEAISDLLVAFKESGLSLGEVAGLLAIVLGEVALAFVAMLGAMTALQPSWQSIAAAAVILGGFVLVLESVTKLIKTFSESGMTLNDVIGLMATVLISIVALMGSVALLGPAMTAGMGPFLVVIAGLSAILIVMSHTLPTILEAVEKFITGTAPALTKIIDKISDGISKIIESIGTVLPPIIESIGNIFTKIFDGIAKVITTVADTVIRLQDSTITFIEKLGPAINKFVDGVIQAVTKLINFLISAIEYMVNLVISGVNKIIDAINSVGEKIGFVIPNIPAFEIPRFVPKLARGGIVAKPTQAVIGEAGREAVMPLDNNTGWMDTLAEKLSERMPTGNGGQEVVVRFEGTLSQFVRQLKPYIEVENKRAGSRLIAGGAY